ncbi:MAG: preprotein translocase subunit SecE [Nitrospirae bacterium]|nr:preprotein translocase subunit SecE [Nitrospirota bacterium]MBF0520417.1 preprotein translocase subunit SecE [Nitrospirota bacterium]MBF0535271.1 preprotein translocase subunit SecE [Nitrospirota bacterium]MBF0615249.1 preprotein translocase subunit SecE [Nitrospirota bacterium]
MVERIKAFLKEVKIETKKVVFPGREELIGSTWVVVIFVIIVSFFLGIVDLGLTKMMQNLIR